MAQFWSQNLCQGWELKCLDDHENDEWLPVAKVPTVVHLDLIANKKISDPNVDRNELAAYWVDEKRWRYRCQFTTPSNLQRDTRIFLVFEGLDTYAKVHLNDTAILETDNMFLSHHIDVTNLVHGEAANHLAIDFEPAIPRAKEVRDAHPEHCFLASLGGSERLAVRKAQYHWGWDWGPACASAGPWRPVRLETFRSRIKDTNMQYKLDSGLKSCTAEVSVEVDGHPNDTVRVILRTPEGNPIFDTTCGIDSNGNAQTNFALENPLLWYPYGYGDQPLYYLDTELLVDGTTVHLVTKRIAFRKAELVQEPDKYGKSFFFRINDIDIFAGGSCWIPGESFLPRLTPDDYREWLKLMIQGNQIMTRVWGGGIFEEDVFYDTCDELGILVWQDFMFACGSYPGYQSFLDSVEAEARENVRRLRHHPSIVIYAGGNENYYIQELNKLEYNYEGDKDPQSWLRSSFPSRYIYESLLPKVVGDESPSVCYHVDSPWGDGKNILDDTVGDIHQWEVWHGIMRPYQDYRLVGGRFNSEFGMQSYPHMNTVNKFVTDDLEKHPQSLTVDFHNKCKTHERRLATYVRENFRASDSSLENWVYLTQLVQSEAMYYAYRAWRREWGSCGARRCGGALVWQMNDCWPGISWAVVDYFRVKKPAFHSMKRALSPLALAVVRTHDNWTKGHSPISKHCNYDVWIAGDGGRAVKMLQGNPLVEVELRFISIHSGEEAFPTQRFQVADVDANGSTTVCDAVQLPNIQGRGAFIIAAKLIVGGNVVSREADWPQPLKFVSFHEDRGLKVCLDESRRTIEVTAQKPVKGLIFAERPGLSISDNAIDVVPGETYHIDVQCLDDDEQLQWSFLGMNEAKSG